MPDWRGHLRPLLTELRLSPAREAEIVEELSQHLGERYEELRTRGASDEDAIRDTAAELLEPASLANYMRSLRQANVSPVCPPEAPGGSLLGDFGQDLRYGVRALRKQPGFALAAVLTLALGIGANGAIFALVDAVLLRPLPLAAPERLMTVWERTNSDARDRVSPLNLMDWNSRNHSFTNIAGFIPGVGGMVMAGADGMAETVSRQWVTDGIFETLGIRPVAGRTFLPADDRQRSKMVVLSEGFWRTRFHGDKSVVGRPVRLDGAVYTIAGVVPDEAQVIGKASMWALLSMQGAPPNRRALHALRAVGRLKAGVTREAANADLAAIAKDLEREFPKTNSGRGVALEPLRDTVIGSELRRTSMLFLGAAGFVLLICCTNVANLMLARALARGRELAVRAALGASRSRMIRQLLTESLVLSMAAGGLGLAMAAGILKTAPRLMPGGLIPAGVGLEFDLRAVAFCTAVALLAGGLFGAAPAWQAAGLSMAGIAHSGSRGATGRGGRIRGLLVAGEVATAVMLLFGSGLLLRTLIALDQQDRGYQAKSVLTMIVDPLGSQYPTPQKLLAFYDAVEKEVRGVPGVRDVAWASTLPLGPSYAGRSQFEVEGQAALEANKRPSADYQIVSPAYFRTVELPVVAGRGFSETDTRERTAVCMVNEAFVRRYLADAPPIGRKVLIRGEEPQAKPTVREIVGVARQVKGRPDEKEEMIQIYVPLAQEDMDDMFMAVRPKSGRAGGLARAVRAAIGRVDRENLVSVRSVMTLEDVEWEATERHRFRAVLAAAFAGLALVLAMIGLSGVLGYSVQQQVRDFGVRRALGATTGDVLGLVAKSMARMVGAGAVIGLALGVVVARLLATVLFGVEALDPVTLVWTGMVLLLTAVISAAAPAWRAARIDPVIALRDE